jgi:hypothetical protein
MACSVDRKHCDILLETTEIELIFFIRILEMVDLLTMNKFLKFYL